MYIVRADGNARIGAGHLMRCLTIAEAMVRLSVDKKEIIFVCADEFSAELARGYGFEAKVLGSDYQKPEEELPRWEALLLTQAGNTILVDSYYVTEEYLKQLRRFGRVFLMDDLQECSFPVDGVINYNAFADKAVYQKLYQQTKAKCYVGSSYVPIRPQFLQRTYQVKEKVRHIMITTGGGDQNNIAGAILQCIYQENKEYHLVVGKYNPHKNTLEEWAATHKGVHIYYDVKDMAGLMARCDLAITAGGTTIYELAAIGVPLICFSYAKNQEALTEYIGSKNIAGYAGAYHSEQEATLEKLKCLVQEFNSSKEKRQCCHVKEKQLIDGLGAERLAKVLMG
ncbi:MAG: UDP-2,4-diacetamido-2,4,6-trideoxy-beta-L-altropyranose hydrolase [Lachnospiraceae bacterium]|nr:UDP-2,4-diacetamido-2,4,6-trideoxy-beta-L-altropyranose hydrolase [Lachnospiraceae bacterium]